MKRINHYRTELTADGLKLQTSACAVRLIMSNDGADRYIGLVLCGHWLLADGARIAENLSDRWMKNLRSNL